MATTTTTFARAYLRKVYADAQTAGETLLARLNALNSAAVAAVSSGKVVSATSGNGRSVEFQVNGTEGVTPTAVAELTSRLLDLYEAAVAAGNATDATRFAWMLARLKPVRSFRSDYSSAAVR